LSLYPSVPLPLYPYIPISLNHHRPTTPATATRSELDCNLAVAAYLRACTKFGGAADASPTALSLSLAAPDALSDLFPLLYRMQSQRYGVHPAIRDDFDPASHAAIPARLREFLGGVQVRDAMRCDAMCLWRPLVPIRLARVKTVVGPHACFVS